MAVILTPTAQLDPARAPMEVVELKGLGHPDTLCDALAEEACAALCRAYLDRFGAVLHHNVDKVLLIGGTSRPAFGGGEVLAPMEIHVAGRATREVRGVQIPVEELVLAACREWIDRTLPGDTYENVRLYCHLRPGSPELVDLFLRQARSGVWRSNDTSIGVGFAPLTPLERTVRDLGARLVADTTAQRYPALGKDIKIMGIRREDQLALTVAVAMIDGAIAGIDDYRAALRVVEELAREVAEPAGFGQVSVSVNAADDLERGTLYLTVTGTSAESGDDGEAGRGNRASGLITPYRPMTMESVAGKNPYSHVGKLYNVVAQQIAEDVAAAMGGAACHCVMVSRIGAPVGEPQAVELTVAASADQHLDQGQAEEIVAEHLAGLGMVSEILARTGLPVMGVAETRLALGA